MVTSAFMRHNIAQRRVRETAAQAATWVTAQAVPVALSLGVCGLLATAPAPVFAQASLTTVLNQGDQGEAVTRLQQRLAELGFFSGEATGFYGPQTAAAIIRYQDAQGLLADGVAGPETLGVLLPNPAVAAENSQRTSLQLDDEQLLSLQAKLSRLGFYLGEVDGLYGPQTEAAINSFQNVYALPITGVTDRRTLATLDRVYSQTSINNVPNGDSAITQGLPAVATPTQVFSTGNIQTQVSTASVSLPPAIPSGPALLASIPQTTSISSPLPPPSLPNGQQANFGGNNFGGSNFDSRAFSQSEFGQGNFENNFGNNPSQLPPLSDGGFPIGQTPQVAAAPSISGYPYIVAIPIKTGATLSEVRQTATNAFLAGSKRGTYIQAGAYNSREDAERATQILRDRRLDARVVYRPN